jgi:hypothetical protein
VRSVPEFVRFNGTVNETHRSAIVAVSFAVYREGQGGIPLWSETQNVSVDANGRFAVLLGSSRAEGRLGVQVLAGAEPEQPRVLLVSVPYALKAQDAETLGGRSLNDFVLQSTLDRRLSDLGLTTGSPKTTKRPGAAIDSAAASTTEPQGAFFGDPTLTNNYKWLELTTQAGKGNYNGVLYNFANAGDPAQDNWVMRLGYNIGHGGNREDYSRPAIALEWESNFSPYLGQNVQEFHLAHVSTDGLVQRPITFYHPTIGKDSLGLNNSVLQLGDAAANIKAYFGLGGNFDWYLSPYAPDNQRIYFLRTTRNSAFAGSVSGTTTTISFQKQPQDDYWQIGNAFTVSHAGGNVGMGSVPVPYVRLNILPTSAVNGIDMHGNEAPPQFFFRATVGLAEKFMIERDGKTRVAGTVTAPNFIGNLTGTASQATAFAADPADCLTARFATAIAANGDLTCAPILASDLPSLSGSYVDLGTAQTIAGIKTFSSPIIADITGSAGMATVAGAFAADPADCLTARFATAIAANGDLTCAPILASDLPSLSGSYVDLTATQTIAGAKTFTSPVNVTATLATAQSYSVQQIVAFSVTPTFDAGTSNNFKLILGGNVTSSSLSNAVPGQTLVFLVCQDGTGGRTFAWPANFKTTMTIGGDANKCSAQQFYFDGTSAFALTAGVVNQ